MIRRASEADQAAVRALWELCFPDASGFNDYFFDHQYHAEHTLVCVEDGVLCAMVQMLPYQLALGRIVREATYIYGACTHPEHRRRHLMAQLLERSFELDRQQGRAASFLIPQEAWLFDFYRPFGYLPVFTIGRHRVIRTAGETVPLHEIDDPAALSALYDRLTENCSVRVLRSEQDWRDQLALFRTMGVGVFGLKANGRLTAYAFVWREGDGLYAQELLAENEAQTEALCQALMARFEVPTLRYESVGGQPMGCIKPHIEMPLTGGYLNLMFN